MHPAPKGQEGSYLALSTIPIFFARPLVGIFSGWLLTTYCPAGDTSQHQMVWVWIGATALITPLGLIFLRNFFVTKTSAE